MHIRQFCNKPVFNKEKGKIKIIYKITSNPVLQAFELSHVMHKITNPQDFKPDMNK